MIKTPFWLSLARLLRLPNVFSAVSNIFVGLLITHQAGFKVNPIAAVLLVLTSALLYLSGMVWNDYFDFDEDLRDRPFRPLPSGQISKRFGASLATLLMLFAVVSGFFTDWIQDQGKHSAMHLTLILIAFIFLYDGVLKSFQVAPLVMGFCRFLNVLLAFSFLHEEYTRTLTLGLASWVGLYIVAVTFFARNEERLSSRRLLQISGLGISLLLLSIPLIHLALEARSWYLAIPGWILLLWLVSGPMQKAIKNPEPSCVQAAVKACILNLIVIDAVLAAGFVGWIGYSILLLLIPARLIARRVYST
jgi:1,4-dihydroxy-2-naphthoate octaprenyltransferase